MFNINMKESKTTLTFGKYEITNIPVLEDEHGEKLYNGFISLRISEIYDYMKENNLYTFSYDNHKDFDITA